MSHKIRILVIEDDEELRETLQDLLSDEGFEVQTAGRGEEAVRLSSERVFDLVVTDVKMPGIDGLEALAQVKQHQPEVKSLVITGYSSHQDAVRAVKLGVGEYMQKPFALDSLLARIREMGEERRAELADALRETESLQALESVLRLAAHLVDERISKAGALAARLDRQAPLLTLAAGIRHLADHNVPFSLTPPLEERLSDLMVRFQAVEPAGFEGAERSVQVAAWALFKTLYPGREVGSLFPESVTSIPANVSTKGERRSLLAVAQAFERGGDLENAYSAYQSLLEQPAHDTFTLEAMLGQARLARSLGNPDLLANVNRLLEVGRTLGPRSQARAVLESGLLLLPHPQAELCLKEAEESCRNLADDLGLARAQLGLASLGHSLPIEDALSRLLRPEHSWELVDSAYWLLPWLLATPDRVDKSTITALLMEAPGALRCALDAGNLSVEARITAVQALENGPIPMDALRILAGDTEPQVQAVLQPIRERLKLGSCPTLRLQSFGPFKVYRGEQPLDDKVWKHQKVRYLLAFLAKHWRTPVSEQQVLAELWPGPADRARRSLYQATYNLRLSLNSPESSVDYVVRERGHLSLNPQLPIANDLKELEQALDLKDIDKSKSVIIRALDSYSGPYLDGCLMDWAIEMRESLEVKVLEMLERLVHHSLNLKQYREGLEFAERLHEIDPLNHAGQVLKMKVLVALNDPEPALEHFQRCATILSRELGEEPSIELLELQQRAKLQGSSGMIG